MVGNDLITTYLGNETSGIAILDTLSKIPFGQYIIIGLVIVVIWLVIKGWFR
jgi:hypothetical protein